MSKRRTSQLFCLLLVLMAAAPWADLTDAFAQTKIRPAQSALAPTTRAQSPEILIRLWAAESDLALHNEEIAALLKAEEIANAIADKAVAIMEGLEPSHRGATAERKPDGSVRTVMDVKIQEMVCEEIFRLFPHHYVFGEEIVNANLDRRNRGNCRSDWVWIVDPMDGSEAYAENRNDYGFGMLLVYKGQPMVSVARVPRFTIMLGKVLPVKIEASAWQGVLLNGKPLREKISQDTEVKDWRVLVRSLKDPRLEGLKEIYGAQNVLDPSFTPPILAAGIRVLMGSQTGIAAYARPRAPLWDWAPIGFILQLAGGDIAWTLRESSFPIVASDLDGTPLDPFNGFIMHRSGVHADGIERLVTIRRMAVLAAAADAAKKVSGQKHIEEALGKEVTPGKVEALKRYILTQETRLRQDEAWGLVMQSLEASARDVLVPRVKEAQARYAGRPVPSYRIVLLKTDKKNGHDESGLRVSNDLEKIGAHHFWDKNTRQWVFATTQAYVQGVEDSIVAVAGVHHGEATGIALREIFGHAFDEAILDLTHTQAALREGPGGGALSYRMLYDLHRLSREAKYERIDRIFSDLDETGNKKELSPSEQEEARAMLWKAKNYMGLEASESMPEGPRRLKVLHNLVARPVRLPLIQPVADFRKSPEPFKASLQGTRRVQEDCCVFEKIDAGQYGKVLLMAVIDGHRGDGISKMVAEALPKIFTMCLAHNGGDKKRALEATIAELQKLTRGQSGEKTGCTISIVAIFENENRAYVAILGDSPVIIVDKDGRIHVSPVHSAFSNPESAREAIRKGADYNGVGLVHHGILLMMSRCLGDNDMDSVLTREPDIYHVDLSPHSLTMLLTDGVWDPGFETNEDLLEIIQRAQTSDNPAAALADFGVHVAQTGDNATAVVYRGAPMEEAILLTETEAILRAERQASAAL